jgi:hypothetical protein
MKLVALNALNPGNLVPRPWMKSDADSDGVADGFVAEVESGITANLSPGNECQLVKITAATGAGDAALVSDAFALTPGDVVSLSVDAKLCRATGSPVVRAYLVCHDISEGETGTSSKADQSPLGVWTRLKTEGYTVPATTHHGHLVLVLRAAATDNQGCAFFRLARVAVEATAAAYYDEYTFPAFTCPSERGIKVRSKLQARAFSHGQVDTGDGKFDSRSVKISVTIPEAATESAFDAAVNNILTKVCRDDLLLYEREDGERYIKIKRLLANDLSYVKGLGTRMAQGTIELANEDPFYYGAEDSYAAVISSSPLTVVITNDGAFETYPTMVIWATTNAVDFTIENLTDDARQFRFDDPGFLAGQIVTLDHDAGTVIRNGASVARFFAGYYLRLLPGENRLRYTFNGAGDGHVKMFISWRERYL